MVKIPTASPSVEASHAIPAISHILAELRAIDADRLAIEQSGHSLPRGICPATRAQEAALSAIMDRFYGTVGAMTETTAVTFGDFQAKAEALSIALRLLTFGGHDPEDTANGTLQERLAWSLCRDLLGMASASTPKGA